VGDLPAADHDDPAAGEPEPDRVDDGGGIR
jgi:hypothetical protein